MPPFKPTLDNILMLLQKYWYIIAILILLVVVIVLLSKNKKKKIEKWDQIKENKKMLIEEFSWNPTEIKYLRHGNKWYKVYGETWKRAIKFIESPPPQNIRHAPTKEDIQIWNIRSMKKQILEMRITEKAKEEELKASIKGETLNPIISHGFLVRRNYLDLLLFKWYIGEKRAIFLEREDLWNITPSKVRINTQVRFVDDGDMLVKFGVEFIELSTEKSERLMRSHLINALGKQQLDFSRIDNENAHKEVIKTMDLEAEKEKKRPVAY